MRVVSLHGPVLAVAVQSGRVLSVHQRAVNLELEDGTVLSLVEPSLGNGPGAVLVEADWPLSLRTGDEVAVGGGWITRPGLGLSLAGASRWEPAAAPGLGAGAAARSGWERAVADCWRDSVGEGLLPVTLRLLGQGLARDSAGRGGMAAVSESCREMAKGESGKAGVLGSRPRAAESRAGMAGVFGSRGEAAGTSAGMAGVFGSTREAAGTGAGNAGDFESHPKVAQSSAGMARAFGTYPQVFETGPGRPGDFAHGASARHLPQILADLAAPGLLALRAGRWTEAVSSLVGLGPGLTPSGDDLLAGFACLAHRAGWDGAAGLATALRDLPPGRTTTLSHSLLRWAADGVANERALIWADLLLAGAPAPLGPVLAIGATSGADWVAGALLALDLCLKEVGA